MDKMSIKLLLLALPLVTLYGTMAFHWTSETEDAGHILKCLGDNVTFGWSYQLDPNERVIVKYWHSRKNGSFANFFSDQFRTSSERVMYQANAGMILTQLQVDDNDVYAVDILVFGNSVLKTQAINLTVAEPPRLEQDLIHVLMQDSKSLGNESFSTSINSDIILLCGRFEHLGYPPISVVWKDPFGNELQSTNFQNGYFYLSLSSPVQAGNYSCQLRPKEVAMNCLPPGSTLQTEAAIMMETIETRIVQLRDDLDHLTKIINSCQCKFSTVNGSLDTYDQVFQEFRYKLENLQYRLENLTLKLTFSEYQSAEKNSITENVKEELENVKMDMTRLVANIENMTRQHNVSIINLKNESLTSQFAMRQDETNKLMQNKLFNLLTLSHQLQSKDAELREKLLNLSSQAEEDKPVIENLKQEISQLQKQRDSEKSSMQSRLEAIELSIQEQQTASSELLQTMRNLTQTVDLQKTEIQHLSTKLNKSENTNIQLENEINTLKKSSIQCENITAAQQTLLINLQRTSTDLRASYLELLQKSKGLTDSIQNVEATRNASFNQLQTNFDQKLNECLVNIRLLENDTIGLKQKSIEVASIVENHAMSLQLIPVIQNKLDAIHVNISNISRSIDTLSRNQTKLVEEFETKKNTSSEAEQEIKSQLRETLNVLTSVNTTHWKQTMEHNLTTVMLNHLRTNVTNLQNMFENQIMNVKSIAGNYSFQMETHLNRTLQDWTLASQQQHNQLSTVLTEQINSLRSEFIDLKLTHFSSLNRDIGDLRLQISMARQIRLVNGLNIREGRVEILSGVEWGTVCDDGWDSMDAGVVCVMLGFSRLGAIAKSTASFGQGIGPIFLDDLECSGNEMDVRSCPRSVSHNCNHGEDAGVVCQP